MVSYAKGTLRPAAVDAGWPHHVEMEVPWNGLGRCLGTMAAWVQAHAAPPDSAKRRGVDAGYDPVCLHRPGDRGCVPRAFGGTLFDVPPPTSSRRMRWPT